MFTRALPVVFVVAVLGGLIAYSKYRPKVDHVSGFLEADEIRIGSRVGGRVAKVHVEEGATVSAGQLLVELEPFDLAEQRQEAAASLAAREADYQRLKTGLRSEEVAQAKARFEQLQARLDRAVAGPRQQEIDAARAELRVAEAVRKLAIETYNRARQLRESGALTPQEMDRASENLESAEGELAARQQQLSLLEAGTREEEVREARAMADEARLAWQLAEKGFREEEIAQAAAARDAAQAALAALDRRLAELQIRSPIAGTVEALELREGDLAPAGGPVLSVVDDAKLWVRAYVPENRLDVSLDQPVQVTVDSRPGKRYAARVTFIGRQSEFTPANVQTPEERVKQVFRIKATLEEGLEELRPGMPADVWLDQ
jgi:multidrug resistance efflux pump